jgi:Fe-S-cluster containining protein
MMKASQLTTRQDMGSDSSLMSADNVCMRCGACCAFFRVSFYWGESTESGYGTVPAALTEKVNDTLLCMQGTNQKQVRCIALTGEIGQSVSCSIYSHRSSTCREFAVSHDSTSACSRARAYWNLPPVSEDQDQG